MSPWCKSALVALLCCGLSTAAPTLESHIYDHSSNPLHKRQVGSTSTGQNATLEPIIPLSVNTGNLSILALGTSVPLAWAGSTATSKSRKMMRRDGASAQPLMKRDGSIQSAASFVFQYPTIPLDHSTYISGVSCSGNNSLTGSISSTAYSFVKGEWTNASKILFVTSVDGCGSDDQNYLFLSNSITFSDSAQTFTASGSPSSYKSAGVSMSLEWGAVPPAAKIKRASDKTVMYEPMPIDKRAYASLSIDWDVELAHFFPVDELAPFENAIQLANFTKSGGREDESAEEGESESQAAAKAPAGTKPPKRSTSLSERAESKYEYGLGIYCVDCGFSGSATVWGRLDVDILFFEVTTAQIGFDASFEFDINYGIAAFVDYQKEWTDQLAYVPIDGFDIPLLCDIGPFVSVSASATVTISATGTLLIGAGIEYPSMGFTIDLLNPGNSNANFDAPVTTSFANATGELSVEVEFGLPIKLGLGVNILDGTWEADGAIVDTPSLNILGEFEVDADILPDGSISTSVNDGCYGVAWSVFFENKIQAELYGQDIGTATYDLFDPYKSDPFASGCIGYVDDGTQSGGAGLSSGGAGLSSGSGLAGGSQPGVIPPASSSSSPLFVVPSSTSKTSTKPSSTSTSTSTSSSPASSSKPASSSAKPTTTLKTSTTSSSSSSTTSARPTAKCTPGAIIPASPVPSGATCAHVVANAAAPLTNSDGKSIAGSTLTTCATACLKDTHCASWGLTSAGVCQMYIKSVLTNGITTKAGNPTVSFNDKTCYVAAKCSS